MNLQTIRDRLYITRTRAVELGFTHEGTHFGVPVWVQYEEGSDMMDMVATKTGLLEWVITLGAYFLQMANLFREPGDELLFPFCIRPIRVEVAP